MKTFYTQYNIGKAKYTVSFHDGISTHEDGSDFFDIVTFSNKKEFKAFINKLKKKNYVER